LIVGLLDAVVQESKAHMRAAAKNSGFPFLHTTRQVCN
jgi:predicted ATPase with chaperone activity